MESAAFPESERLSGAHVLYRLFDASLVVGCGLAAAEWRLPSGTNLSAPPIHLFLIAFCSLAALLVFPAFRLYGSWRGRQLSELLLCILAAWCTVYGLGILLSFLMHQSGIISFPWASAWFILTALSLVGLRLGIYAALGAARDRGLNQKRVLIVGFGTLGRELWRRVEHFRATGYEVAGIYTGTDERLPSSVRRLTSLEGLSNFIREASVREVWIVLPMEQGQKVHEVLFQLRNDLVDIRWIPDMMSIRLLGHRIDNFMGLPAIQLNSLPAIGIRGWAKEMFDRVFSLGAIIAFSPAMLVIAVLVKLTSRGPVLFKQPRLGVDGKVFNVYKFRTMTVHEENGTVTQATRNDARVTRLGAFLRATSLDELPQFFNVLKGDMSVVGPRPHALAHNELYKDVVDRYMMRHRVKPGITGWAQVNGYRGQTETVHKMRARIEFDLYYIQHWSFLMDLRIIARTALSGWTGRNAY
ncbi:undecaprenyl-phosphate glucose phosphotransferase [Pigmentiphaga sp. NML080357]|uniref:undecaprenyl-phosphate glucose phosphotransferase n=1 Tax=Pigmentiphaga sp. NML080357 TaxID=2008675 RepID=UPI000B41F5F8|nr:undecaprenyl-phosphate glucose phosphotransferase [Pigmentiphaga sp. NML080357]OVZ58487.1 undecaprenyl-phosphate glucose phosphotransferase [Pigmentiphaga sp. NML080357]